MSMMNEGSDPPIQERKGGIRLITPICAINTAPLCFFGAVLLHLITALQSLCRYYSLVIPSRYHRLTFI